ncbi:hypothetical protein [Haloarcula marismortui]|uniref:Uncharacterized protein n=1 Tax=Haloarcula marismortui ATCC 33800 TaxID=662476 RepID=M0K280_9EURY|nr:hypothetical protein [Haloarcula sinaiiensis]EMA14898.1 hypothetical protein C436_05526 [Haloarcula sinaiiensis ATCC 33800]QUJ71926.1 hypothetical protein KDQ40_14725 [Haloarcula sinaiiensis ATCC 33800]
MSLFDPDELEYDEDLYERLNSLDKANLVRFYNLHCEALDGRRIGDSAHTKDGLRKIISAKLQEQAEEYLESYDQLRRESVRVSPAIEYIAGHFDIQGDDLDVDTRYELLLLIYEQGINEALDELIVRSKMETYSASRNYLLDSKLDFDGLDERLWKFHEIWNRETDNEPLRVEIEFDSANITVFKIYHEVGPQHPQTFQFRESDEDTDEVVPIEPEVTNISYHQLKTMRIQTETGDGETEIVFSEPFTRWRTILPQFFASVFDVANIFDEIDEVRSEIADEIEEDMLDAVDSGDDPIETARDTISDRQSKAEEEVEEMDIPESQKEKLKDRINTIAISGSEITGDQSIETQEFRLIAGLEGLFSSVDIEEGFKDMIEKADSDKQSFVLTVDDRPVELSDGQWNKLGPGQLRDLDRRALETFFDSEIEL